MSQTVVQTILAADLAPGGTITINYPAGKTRGDFVFGKSHYVIIGQSEFDEPLGASFAFNATTIVITYRGTGVMLANSPVVINLDEPGAGGSESVILPGNVISLGVVDIDLGSPIAGAANNIGLSQSVGLGAFALLNGATVVNGVAILDVPRTLVGAWTTNSVVTIIGYDKNGVLMSEQSALGAVFTGKKAFAKVISIQSSVAITVATFGTGNVLGLPVWLPGLGYVAKELQDGAVATAGTVVAGLATATLSTTTTADVRGTYTPNATPDGLKAFKLFAFIEDPAFQGNAQA